MSSSPRVSPPVVLAAGIAGIALVLALTTSLRMPALVSFDESVYKLSASQYATRGLDGLLDDSVARGIARLYSLVLAPLFALLPGDAAVRAARALGTVLFALAAVPVYLLARRVVRSRWAAVGAALLSILVPWVTVSTVLFSEALAYPLFATAVLAMVWALQAPSPRRDVVVLALLAALIGVRPQFAALPVAWIALVAWLELVPARRRTGSWRAAVTATWRRFPVLLGLIALGVLAFVALAVAGRGAGLLRRIGGPYVGSDAGLNADVLQMGLFELSMLALGTGLVPFVLALAWLGRALRGKLGDDARRVAAVALAAVVAVFGVALAALGQFPGPDVAEERYFIYAAPLILVAAFAALELPRIPTATLAAGGVLVLALLALTPITAGLSSERAFLVPVAATLTNVAGRLDPAHAADLAGLAGGRRMLVLALGLVILALAAVAWRRARWAALIPAVVVQLGFGGYALATMHGKVPGVPGVVSDRPFAELAWIDHATRGGPEVSVLADGSAAQMVGDIGLTFFNDEADRTTRFPGVADEGPPYPVSALPSEPVQVGADLVVTPPPATRLVVATAGSPYVQLAGRRVAASPDGAETLVALARPARATWVARGLGPLGAITTPVTVVAAPARLTLAFETGAEPGRGDLRLAGKQRRISAPAGARHEVTIDACGAAGPATGQLRTTGGALFLRAVHAAPCDG